MEAQGCAVQAGHLTYKFAELPARASQPIQGLLARQLAFYELVEKRLQQEKLGEVAHRRL